MSRPRTAHDRVCTAVSILQAHVLAMDSNLFPEKLWGPTMAMPSPAIEHVVDILIGVIGDLDGTEGR